MEGRTMAPLSSSIDLAEHRADSVVALLTRNLVPLFSLDSREKPDFEGTGVLLRVGASHFLVSAAHVFDVIGFGGCLMWEGLGELELSGTAILTKAPDGGGRDKDRVDLGVLQLTDGEVARIGERNFLSRRDLAPQEAAAPQATYLAVGFIARDQLRDDDRQVYKTRTSRYLGMEAGEDAYHYIKVIRDSHLALAFDRRNVVGPRGRGAPPSFKGMSGCGVWRLNPLVEYTETLRPSLVATLIEQPPEYPKSLLCTRVELLLAVIRKSFPELAHEIPPSPLLSVRTQGP